MIIPTVETIQPLLSSHAILLSTMMIHPLLTGEMIMALMIMDTVANVGMVVMDMKASQGDSTREKEVISPDYLTTVPVTCHSREKLF